MNSEAGTLLVEGSLITEAQLQQALASAIQHGGTLVQSLIRLGYVSGAQLASFLASRLRLPMAEHSQFDNLPAFITRLIPNDIVLSHRLVPIMLHKGVLHVAMSDPTDRTALEEIGFATGYTASPVVAPCELVVEAMARYYGIPPDELVVENPPIEPAPTDPPALQPEDSQPPTAFASPVPDPAPSAEALAKAEANIGLDQAKKSLEVVETEEGEMEELFFGLGREDKGVVHLTRRKDTDPILRTGTITDAIRTQAVQAGVESSRPGLAGDLPQEVPPPEPEKPAEPVGKPAEPVAEKNSEPVIGKDSTEEYLEGLMASRRSVFSSPVGQTPKPEKVAPPPPTPIPTPEKFPLPASRKLSTPAVSVQLPDIDVSEPEYETETEPLRDFEEVKARLTTAANRDEVAQILIRFALDFFPRLALFIVRKDTMVGWMGAGAEITNKLVKGIMIPMGSPSVFRTVKETATDYFGSLPRTTVNDMFVTALGSHRPRQVLVVPINVRNKPVSIFYGDCGTSLGFMKDMSPVYRIIQEASRSFEKIILSAKMGRKVIR